MRVIASPDDEQEKRLHTDDMVTLRWDVMEDYVGPAAATIRERIVPVH